MTNTAPLAMEPRLFATSDVGRTVEVGPVSLGFLAEGGHQRSWSGSEARRILAEVVADLDTELTG